MEPCRIGREGGDKHPPLRARDLLRQAATHRCFGAGCFRVEDVGRIADQHVDAGIAAFKKARILYAPGKAANAGGVRIAGLGRGDYAVSVIHDENNNAKLDTFAGIPREGFGFSRNPAIRFGPPKFSAADPVGGEHRRPETSMKRRAK